jgi:hypothetical protein
MVALRKTRRRRFSFRSLLWCHGALSGDETDTFAYNGAHLVLDTTYSVVHDSSLATLDVEQAIGCCIDRAQTCHAQTHHACGRHGGTKTPSRGQTLILAPMVDERQFRGVAESAQMRNALRADRHRLLAM